MELGGIEIVLIGLVARCGGGGSGGSHGVTFKEETASVVPSFLLRICNQSRKAVRINSIPSTTPRTEATILDGLRSFVLHSCGLQSIGAGEEASMSWLWCVISDSRIFSTSINVLTCRSIVMWNKLLIGRTDC